ncbi:MAG: hypothetical protein LBH52_04705 [Puniceicoccales bacterium]|jgi:hypothetical protein|nr:hypothetical protein [Puniceicoccales bacterium]
MKTVKFILINIVVLLATGTFAQEKIFVTVDGTISEGGKEDAKKYITETINQSVNFRASNSESDILIATTINKNSGNFEMTFKATHKSGNFDKNYNVVSDGYRNFEEKIKSTMKEILAELPQNAPIVQPQQPQQPQNQWQPMQTPNDDNLTVTHNIPHDTYTLPTYEHENRFDLDLSVTMGMNNGLDVVAKWWLGKYFGLGIGAGLYTYQHYEYDYYYDSDYSYPELTIPIFAHLELQIPQLIGERWTPYLAVQYGPDVDSEFEYFYGTAGLGVKFKLNDKISFFGGLALTIETEGEEVSAGLRLGVSF